MARRRDPGMTINLFPFLSILVCIIGCLTLIIVVLNLSQMNKAEGQTPDEVIRAQEWLVIKKEKEEKQEELDKLKLQIENIIQMNRESIARREKLTKLKALKENQEEINQTRNELIVKINALKKAIDEFDVEFPQLQKKIDELLAEIEKRELPADPPKLRVRPSGSGTLNFPYFVEAANNSLFIHKSLSEEPTPVPLAGLDQNKEFIDLLKFVSAKSNNRLIFLVRGNQESANSYRKAKTLVDSYNANNNTQIVPGRLPLPADGKVDLAPFARYLRP